VPTVDIGRSWCSCWLLVWFHRSAYIWSTYTEFTQCCFSSLSSFSFNCLLSPRNVFTYLSNAIRGIGQCVNVCHCRTTCKYSF